MAWIQRVKVNAKQGHAESVFWFGASKHVVFGVSAGVFLGSGGFGCLRGFGVVLILGYGDMGIVGD